MRTMITALCLAAGTALADAGFEADAAIGVRSDDSVALADVDTLAGEADTATLVEAGLGGRFKLNENLRLELGYDFSRTDYHELDAFDLDLHRASAGLGLQLGRTDFALSADHFEGVLAGEDYLVLNQVSPSVSHLFGQRLFVRAAYTLGETQYDAFPARDADSQGLRGDVYWLIDGMRHFIAFGLESKSEDAADDGFDYSGSSATASWGYRFGESKAAFSVRAQLRLEQRDFAVPLEDGRERLDERLRAKIVSEMPLTKALSVTGTIEKTRNQSPLANAELDRTTYSVEVGLSF